MFTSWGNNPLFTHLRAIFQQCFTTLIALGKTMVERHHKNTPICQSEGYTHEDSTLLQASFLKIEIQPPNTPMEPGLGLDTTIDWFSTLDNSFTMNN